MPDHPTKAPRFADLDHGIRLTVRWLRDHQFETSDSGDGVSKNPATIDNPNGDPDALPYPHVFMVVVASALVAEAGRLRDLLRTRGIALEPGMIQASYDPVDYSAVICLTGVDDDMLVTAGGVQS